MYKGTPGFWKITRPLKDNWWYIIDYDRMPDIFVFCFCSPSYYRMIKMLWKQPKFKYLRLMQGYQIPDDIRLTSQCFLPTKYNYTPDMGRSLKEKLDTKIPVFRRKRQSRTYAIKVKTESGQYYIIQNGLSTPQEQINRLRRAGFNVTSIHAQSSKRRIPKGAIILAGSHTNETQINRYLENPEEYSGYQYLQAMYGAAWGI